jgi:tetratricopeptide (TPR) repeat protein
MSRLRVTRGERYDVVDWEAPRADGKLPPMPPEPPRPPPLISPAAFGGIASVIVLAIMGVVLATRRPPPQAKPLAPTLADLSAVHAHVTRAGIDVRGVVRVAKDEPIVTDADGRARVRLDDGAQLVIDRDTALAIGETGPKLDHGRVMALGATDVKTVIALGEAEVVATGATVALERSAKNAKAYAANGELTVRFKGEEKVVHAGETATIEGAVLKVAPERGFDDWTGGLATPWGAAGPPRRALGELWGRPINAQLGEPGSPLTIRSVDVSAQVARESALTEVRSTYFNAGSQPVTGDFRMALPPSALVRRFAVTRNGYTLDGEIALANRNQEAEHTGSEVLEWAGEGWVRGTIPAIAPGQTVTVIIGYVEWLTPRSADGETVVEYRYPLASDAVAPRVGELSIEVDARAAGARSIAAGMGARVNGSAASLRRSDVRPNADFVVDVAIDPFVLPQGGAERLARLYVAPRHGDDEAGATVLVRAEVPPPSDTDGVAIALVLDTSASVDASLFDAERALAEAVLAGLGAKDRAIVLSADQAARAVGPDVIGPVDAARRKAILDVLATLSTGGATDLGRALEAAADKLPDGAPSAMVIYVGDGWATVGDTRVGDILARLSRRPGGAPRLGAVAVGPLANRTALAGLVRGSGPLLEIGDSNDAARAAIALVGSALQPTVPAVELDLGPGIERVYPRGARAVIAGGTASVVGRARGELPTSVVLRYRDAKGAHEERLPVLIEPALDVRDVERRWAAARVEEIALSGRGREAATDVALRAGLLTPWTGLATVRNQYVATSLSSRVLDLGVEGMSALLGSPGGTRGTMSTDLGDRDDNEDTEDALKRAIAQATIRAILDAGTPVRACRDARAALRPELTGVLHVELDLDGEGHADKVSVHGNNGSDDLELDRCVAIVIEGLGLPAAGNKTKIHITVNLPLPPPRSMRARTCSATSTLPMPLRRGVWRERLDRGPSDGQHAAAMYVEAKQTCELPTWTDRRAFLELLLTGDGMRSSFVLIAAQLLEDVGEGEAATLLRRETVRRAVDPDDLRAIQLTLIGQEHVPFGTFKKQYGAEHDDAGRLSVVRRFLMLAPHDARLRRRLIALLEARGDKQALVATIDRFRRDPFADAALLADSASALRRAGEDAEARRAFGELVERAPFDPWARAFLGDRLRTEGLFDDAARAYGVLDELLPDDPASALRSALAHAGAGRLDLAVRMLTRVAATGGRRGDSRLGELSGRTAQALLAIAANDKSTSADDRARLARASRDLPFPTRSTLVVVRSPASARSLSASIQRGPKDAREDRAPDAASANIGVFTFRLDAPDDTTTLRLTPPKELAPSQPTHVRVDLVIPSKGDAPPVVVSRELDLPTDGKTVELALDKAAIGAPSPVKIATGSR